MLPGGTQLFTSGPKKDIIAYPRAWADNFGDNFYRHAQARELGAFDRKGVWNVSEEGQPFSDSPGLNITSVEVIGSTIKQMICNIEQEPEKNGE